MYQVAKTVVRVMTPSQAHAPNVNQSNAMCNKGRDIPAIKGTRRCDVERKQPRG